MIDPKVIAFEKKAGIRDRQGNVYPHYAEQYKKPEEKPVESPAIEKEKVEEKPVESLGAKKEAPKRRPKRK